MKVKDQIDILSRLCRIGRDLSSSTDTDELLAKISSCSSEVCQAEAASIILLDEERNEMYFKKTAGEMGEVIKRIRIPLNEFSIAGYSIINREALIVNDVSSDPRHYKKVDKEIKFVSRSLLAVPIIWGDKVFGCIEVVNKKDNQEFDENDKKYLLVLAHQAAVALKNVFLMERLKNFFSYSVEILMESLETLEPNSKGHIIRVARYATTLARSLGFQGKKLEEIWYAAYFHDIGKLSIESLFMSKKEVETKHTVWGANLIENIKILENCAPYIRHHHEKIDGSGFPDGLKGNEIPIEAQIIGISEDFDEKYIKIETAKEKEELKNNYKDIVKGKFSPEVIDKFDTIIKRYIK